MHIGTIAAIGTLFLCLSALIITSISRCLSKRKNKKKQSDQGLTQELVSKKRSSKSILKTPNAPNDLEEIELSTAPTSFQVRS